MSRAFRVTTPRGFRRSAALRARVSDSVSMMSSLPGDRETPAPAVERRAPEPCRLEPSALHHVRVRAAIVDVGDAASLDASNSHAGVATTVEDCLIAP